MRHLALVSVMAGLGPLAAAQSTTRVSLAADGSQVDWDQTGDEGISISADGRYVAFTSYALLAPGGSPRNVHVYLRDRIGETTERVSVTSSGAPAESERFTGLINWRPSVSADGRFVAFTSRASNLEPDGNVAGFGQIYVRDREAGTTTRASTGLTGGAADGGCYFSGMSADGRFVVFGSDSTNLVNEPPIRWGVYVADRTSGGVSRVTFPGTAGSPVPQFGFIAISGDARYLAFTSWQDDLVPDDRHVGNDTFLVDRETGLTTLVDVSTSGEQGDYGALDWPSVSDDGRYVAFTSASTNLIPSHPRIMQDVYVRDVVAGTTTLANSSSSGASGSRWSFHPKISANGRYVAFESDASNLVDGDTNRQTDVFVHDVVTGETSRASVDSAGVQGDGRSGTYPYDTYNYPVHPDSLDISPDGRFVAFASVATNLVLGDTDRRQDVFVRDRNLVRIAEVVPSAGSEAGGDFVTIRGNEFGDAVRVEFGGARARVLETSQSRLRVRTPAGRGVADVVVHSSRGDATLASGYRYAPAELAARWGTVDVGAGDRQSVLLVNAVTGDPETRETTVGVGQSIVAVMLAPPSRTTARFVCYLWRRSPGASTLTRLPRGIGVMAFPPPFASGSPPVIWNNVGRARALGVATASSRPAPSVLFRTAGVSTPMVLTLQGLVEDDRSVSPTRFSVTNAVVLRIR